VAERTPTIALPITFTSTVSEPTTTPAVDSTRTGKIKDFFPTFTNSAAISSFSIRYIFTSGQCFYSIAKKGDFYVGSGSAMMSNDMGVYLTRPIATVISLKDGEKFLQELAEVSIYNGAYRGPPGVTTATGTSSYEFTFNINGEILGFYSANYSQDKNVWTVWFRGKQYYTEDSSPYSAFMNIAEATQLWNIAGRLRIDYEKAVYASYTATATKK
jgi:hypothetical protein